MKRLGMGMGAFAVILFAAACSKDMDGNKGSDSDINLLVSGKGVRKITEVFNWNAEDVCFQSTGTIGWDGANRVEWMYNFTSATVSVGLYTYKGYRKSINYSTGDTFPTPAFPPNFSAQKAGEKDMYYMYAPGTTTLWYYNPKLTYEGSSKTYGNTYGREGLYPNGDYISTNYAGRYFSQNGGYIKGLVTYYSVNGIEKNITYYTSAANDKDLSRCQGAALDVSGRPLLFILTGDSMKVVNGETKMQLTATATNAMSAPYTSPVSPKGDLYIHRSTDGSKFIILLKETLPVGTSGYETSVASFVYDVNTNKVTNVVPRTVLTDFGNSFLFRGAYANNAGEIYYATKDDNIGRVTATSNTLYKTGFVGSKDVHITYMNIIRNKIFLVVGNTVSQYYQGQAVKAKSAICVVE